MSKSKGVVSGSTPGHGIGFSEDAKARLKLQTLMQNYQQLQKEVDDMKRTLGAANRRKIMVAAEVRFLRRKYHSLVNRSTLSAKLSSHRTESKEVCRSTSSSVYPHHKEALQGRKSGTNKAAGSMQRKAGKRSGKLGAEYGKAAAKDVDTFGMASRDPVEAFAETSLCRTEVLVPNRAPLFDLNEISVGDEDTQYNNAEPPRTMKSSRDENMQNDLKLLLCRSAGEGASSRVAKRKISWQDPVAVRV